MVGQRFSGWVGVPMPALSLALLQEITCPGCISHNAVGLTLGHPHRYLDVSIVLGLQLFPEMPPDSSCRF